MKFQFIISIFTAIALVLSYSILPMQLLYYPVWSCFLLVFLTKYKIDKLSFFYLFTMLFILILRFSIGYDNGLQFINKVLFIFSLVFLSISIKRKLLNKNLIGVVFFVFLAAVLMSLYPSLYFDPSRGKYYFENTFFRITSNELTVLSIVGILFAISKWMKIIPLIVISSIALFSRAHVFAIFFTSTIYQVVRTKFYARAILISLLIVLFSYTYLFIEGITQENRYLNDLVKIMQNFQHFEPNLDGKGLSGTLRLSIWYNCILMIGEFPILGAPSTYVTELLEGFDTHSTFFHLSLEYGVFAAVLTLYYLIKCVQKHDLNRFVSLYLFIRSLAITINPIFILILVLITSRKYDAK